MSYFLKINWKDLSVLLELLKLEIICMRTSNENFSLIPNQIWIIKILLEGCEFLIHLRIVNVEDTLGYFYRKK